MLKAKIADLYDLIGKNAIDIGLASHLVSGQKDYQKFIILGLPRSGSNLLRSSLCSRRNVVAFGELFNEQSHKRRDIIWKVPGYRTTQKALTLRDNNPVAFLESIIFKKMPAYVEAVGFKLFYHHADENWEVVWPYLRQQGLKVLHLKRRNYLKINLSMSVALCTKQYSSRNENKSRQLAIALDYDDCLRWFEMAKAYEKKFDSYFDDSQVVYYEDLVENYNQSVRTVQEYLNLWGGETQTPLVKQARFRLDKAIINFGQLKSRFAGSEWAVFFEPEESALAERHEGVRILKQAPSIPCVA